MKSNHIEKGQSYISLFFLFLLLFNIGFNQSVLANDGPSQPESTGFKPINVSKNVNHFTGDFSYSIPLLDVEGFPITLNYLGSANNDEEASWTGLGWNINVGSVNRQMRGVPDEFNGKDILIKEQAMKSNKTVGLTLNGNIQFGNNQPAKRNIGLGLSLSIFHNNYNGWGHDVGISPSVDLMKSASGSLTAGMTVKSSSSNGLDITPNVSYSSQNEKTGKKDISIGSSVGININSREGAKELQYGFTFKKNVTKGIDFKAKSTGSVSFLTPTYTPLVQMPMSNELYALSINTHGTFMVLDGGVGAMGHFSRQYLAANYDERPLYGYLNYDKAKDDLRGVLDFNREKDIPFSKNSPIVAVPNITYDFFMVNQPEMTSQFRAYRTNTGILYDGSSESSTSSKSLGGELGGGNIFQAGITYNATSGGTWTGKWEPNNQFKEKGDFKNYQTPENPLAENYFFKANDEMSEVNSEFESKIHYEQPINVALMGENSGSYAAQLFKDKEGNGLFPINSDISSVVNSTSNEKINKRNSNFSFLTKQERAQFGFDKEIKSYGLNDNSYNSTFQVINNPNHKDHHISEITVLNTDGRRAIYGIPAYNNIQKDVSFSVAGQPTNDEGIILFENGDNTINNNKGLDNYFNSETTPGYAHSWLMTGLLSPDYQDVTGNGISDDDLGNAYKFNYTRTNSAFNWRIPTYNAERAANFNEGLLADPEDNKASYTEGNREEWYTHSIESKNMIALFYIHERADALGAKTTGIDNQSKKYKLDSIKLYSKIEFQKGYQNATPIKTVHFRYDYSLCQGVKNSNSGGKLTLKNIFFTYGKNKKGEFNSYKFTYNFNPNFHIKNVDRWSNYKDRNLNPNNISSENFPYTIQDSIKAAQYSSAWLLNKVTLPSGGEIKVEYESDDYAYIQNKRAGYMQPLTGLSARIKCNSTGYPLNPWAHDPQDCNYHSNQMYQSELISKTMSMVLHFDLPVMVRSRKEFADLYLKDFDGNNTITDLYFKTKMNLHKESLTEYVSGYAKINANDSSEENYGFYNEAGKWKGYIRLGTVSDGHIESYHPFSYAGWQVLKNSLPKDAYPLGRLTDDLGPLNIILALPTYYQNLQEFILGYGSVAETFGYGKKCEPSQTFIRLFKPDYKKYGGGYRVKRIIMNDKWASLAEGLHEEAEYGQEYKYRIVKDSVIISSGVAEYEPIPGGDENPFRRPIHYKGNQGLFAPASKHYVEEPICEGFFPSPRVGYSNVEVVSINSKGKNFGTGKQIYEFYTAKDFPVKTDRTSLTNNVKRYQPDFILKFLKIEDKAGVYVSQGYTVETNDMHGKPKKETNFNQEGFPIAETEYYYNSNPNNDNTYNLENNIKTINEKNEIKQTKMGVEYDFYTDMRHQSTMIQEIDQEIGGGGFILPIFIPLFIPHFVPFSPLGWMENKYHSSSSMKYINKKGILTKIRKNLDGSEVITENKLWDLNTGNPVLTSVNNEFNDPIYNIQYPAYWLHKGMDYAYKNQGVVFDEVLISNTTLFSIKRPNLISIIQKGDEVILSTNDNNGKNNFFTKAWVVVDPNNIFNKVLVDQSGNIIKNFVGQLKITRSGNRNLISPSVFSASMLSNPASNSSLNITQFNNILNASASTFKEEWKYIDNNRITTLKCINPIIESKYINDNSTILFNAQKSKISTWFGF